MTALALTIPLNPEQRVLIAAGRSFLYPEQSDALGEALAQDLNWELLDALATWHGMKPLLSQALENVPAECLPAGLRAQFQSYNEAHVERVALMLSELTGVVDQLADAGIRAIPFKGPILARQAYGAASAREFADLDLLLEPEYAATADGVMRARGQVPLVDLSRGQLRLYMRSECDRVYLQPRTRLHIELHWAIVPPYFALNLPVTELFRRAETEPATGGLILSRPDTLLVQCVNGAKEMWEKLEWTLAIAALLKGPAQVDWTRLREIARTAGARRILDIGLGLANRLFQASLPDEIAAPIARDRLTQGLIAEAEAWCLAPHFNELGKQQLTRFRLRARERRRDRFRYRTRSWLTPTHRDLSFVRLPPGLGPLYYVLRPIRLAGERLRGIAQTK